MTPPYAARDLAPTLVLFSKNYSPESVASSDLPEDFFLAFSENGFMLSQNFCEYIVNSFEPWLT